MALLNIYKISALALDEKHGREASVQLILILRHVSHASDNKCVKGYSVSLRGFSANVFTSDDSDRELHICFSTAMISSASVLSSPDVELVSVFINFSLLCDRSLHAEVTGMVAQISRSLYISE